MYKCGWNGCEKAYGTLNHLNAHVTMQGHGPKRTPDGKASSTANPAFRVTPRVSECGSVWGRLQVASTRPSMEANHRTRIQGDPKGVEATEEGGGGSAEGRGGAPTSCQLRGSGGGRRRHPGTDRPHRRWHAAPDDVRRIQGAPASPHRVPDERVPRAPRGGRTATASARIPQQPDVPELSPSSFALRPADASHVQPA